MFCSSVSESRYFHERVKIITSLIKYAKFISTRDMIWMSSEARLIFSNRENQVKGDYDTVGKTIII